MSEPVIVPPPPTIPAGSTPQPAASDADVAASMARNFERITASPVRGTKPPPEKPATPPPPAEPTQPPPPPPPPAEKTTPQTTPIQKPEDSDVPSFLEQALRGEPAKPPPAAPDEEWPEELPTFKNSEEAKARYKKWRESYGTLKKEHATLKATPPQSDPAMAQQLQDALAQNKGMAEALSRYGVENSAEFQQQILQPLYAAWGEAARIVKDSGGNPQQLAHAMSLQGKAQFEALDDIFENMPESARAEAHDALRVYRRYEDVRRNALANAPQALEGIRQRETQQQYANMNKQREEMKGVFDRAEKALRDNKLEVLLRTDLPEGGWWNEQGDKIVAAARDLYMENTDMNKVAMACLLAPAAEAYRKLWLNSQKKIGELNKVIKDRIGNEPNLNESGGQHGMLSGEQQLKEDLKKPFHEVFLREFHRQQGASR